MPIQVPNIPQFGFDEANPLLVGMQKGMGLGNQVSDFLSKALARKQSEQLFPDQQALLRAQAQRQQAMANMPFGGQSLPGAAGQVLGLEILRQKYGDNSEQFQQAKKLFELQNQATGSRINYQNTLANNPERFLSGLGKSVVEESNVRAGNLPGGQGGMLPGPTEDIANQYQLQRQKASTDTDTRKRNLFATNIEKTISQIDPDTLSQYSGLKGSAKLAEETSKAPFGKASNEYKDYLKNIQNAELLATQVRQFYGDSIQPAMIERLQRLTNPSSWSHDPNITKSLFDQTTKLLKMEMKTYRDALKGTSVYQGREEKSSPDSNDPLGIR